MTTDRKPTELEVKYLMLMAEGLTNRQIANRLERSESTVRATVRRVQAVVGADTRTHAVARAYQTGFLRSASWVDLDAMQKRINFLQDELIRAHAELAEFRAVQNGWPERQQGRL